MKYLQYVELSVQQGPWWIHVCISLLWKLQWPDILGCSCGEWFLYHHITGKTSIVIIYKFENLEGWIWNYCNRNGHFRFCDGIHGRRNKWSLQSNFLGQSRSQVLNKKGFTLSRMYVSVFCGNKTHHFFSSEIDKAWQNDEVTAKTQQKVTLRYFSIKKRMNEYL